MNTYEDSRIINLNSANAIKNNGTFLSDVYFPFTGLIKDEPDIVEIKFEILNAQFPYSFYNINIYNNVLKISIDGGLTIKTLTLTRGNYNANNLITEIITQLNINSITDITITISAITGCLTFTKATGNFTIYNNGSTLLNVLGFENQDYTSTLSILIAPFPLNLLGTLNLRIISNELSTNTYDSSVNGSYFVLLSVPIEAGNFGLILYDNITQTKSILNNKILNGFDIAILSDDNNYINFNNINWSISIVLTIIRKRIEKTDTTFKDIISPINKLIATIKEDVSKGVVGDVIPTQENQNIKESQDLQDNQNVQENTDNQNIQDLQNEEIVEDVIPIQENQNQEDIIQNEEIQPDIEDEDDLDILLYNNPDLRNGLNI